MKKHNKSHMDHGFTTAQWDFIFTKFADKAAFFIETFELPVDLGLVTNELYGPSAGNDPIDESHVYYAPRGDRAWDSRMVKLPKQPTRFVRVIAGPHEEPCGYCFGEGKTWTASPVNGKFQVECVECKGAKTIKHACILYTAYGVASIDMAKAPKEPGDLELQLEALREKVKAEGSTQEGLEAECVLQAQISLAKIFWSIHALAGM